MKIPVIFTPHEGFATPLIVALCSMFENAKEDTIYDVRLVITSDFSEDLIKEISSWFSKYPKHELSYYKIDDSSFFISDKMPDKPETYFRLFLHELFLDLDKCIYLDGDVCVLNDLTEMFCSQIENNYVAGVEAASYHYPEEWAREHLEEIKLPSIKSYINAGVLLMNLSVLRDEDFTAQCISLYKRNFSSKDQDIVNVACYGRIKILPVKFNAMTKYFAKKAAGFESGKKVYPIIEWEEADKNPVIIHYADPIKVWNDNTRYQSEIWFKYKDISGFDYVEKEMLK